MTVKNLKKMQADQSVCALECKRVVSEMKNMILSGALKPGVKLQPEKKLSENFAASVYVIRMALKQLKEEKLLYSRPKFGIFVAENIDITAENNKPDPVAFESSAQDENCECLRFITQSNTDEQQDMFRDSIAAFRENNPFIDVKVTYSASGEGITHGRKEPVDVVETGIPIFYYKIRQDMLPLNPYFSEYLLPVKEDSTAYPFYYSTRYMFYNPALLRELNCPAPDYRTFDEQTAYWKKVTARAVEAKMSLPGILFPVVNLLGNLRKDIMDDLKDRDTQESVFIKKYKKVFDRCTSYLREYGISMPNLAAEKTKLFQQGVTPFLFSFAAHTITLQKTCRNEMFAMYPVFTVDDKLYRETVPLSVRKNTNHAVECVKFIEHLQKDGKTQSTLAKMGFLPLSEKYYSSLPVLSGETFSGTDPVFFANKEDYYVCYNILNVELCNVILFRKKINEALHDTFQFARAYLNLQLDLKCQKVQQERGEYFI